MHYVKEAFDRNWVAPLGFNCDAFEQEIVERMQSKTPLYGLALASGTAALHLAVKLAGIKPGDVVLCSDMTFAATVNPIVYEGGVPVFVDSEYDTWNMDPEALEKAFERYPQAKVVMLAQLYGTPAKMDAILAVCKKHNAILIEDAAEAHGASIHGQMCGTFGKYNILSFNGNKIITTSGGGMLLTKEESARDKAFFWSTQAREEAYWYQHEEIGYNYRLSNVCAGIGRGQLRYLEEHCAAKRAVYERYQEGLRDLPATMNPYLPDSQPNHWLSCLFLHKEATVDPITILETLQKQQIETRPIWKPMHLQPVFAACDFVKVHDKAVSEDVFARGLCLPSDIKMTAEEQQIVIDAIRACF